MSEVTSHGADFQVIREFIKVRVAHWEALCKEYTKPRMNRLRMSLYSEKKACIRQLFQTVERPQRGQEPKARNIIRRRAPGV